MINGQAIIEAFGGLTRAARAIGVPVSTVQHWRDRDRIPAWRERDVVEAARVNGIDLPLSDSDAA